MRNGRVLFVWALLIALCWRTSCRASVPAPRAADPGELRRHASVASLGQTVVVLTGGIDLSLGPMVSLTNSITATVTDKDSPNSSMVLAAAAALLVGSLGGLVNGVLVAYGRLQPIIVTLATGSIWTGIALYIRPSPGGFIPLDFSTLLSSTAFSDPAPLHSV